MIKNYDNSTNLVKEILVSLAGQHDNGVLPLNARLSGLQELQLIDLATDPNLADDLYDFLSTQIDSNSIGDLMLI